MIDTVAEAVAQMEEQRCVYLVAMRWAYEALMEAHAWRSAIDVSAMITRLETIGQKPERPRMPMSAAAPEGPTSRAGLAWHRPVGRRP